MKKQTSKTIWIAALTTYGIMISSLGLASTSGLAFSKNKNLSGTAFTLQGVGKKSVFFMEAFEVAFYQEKRQLASAPLDNVAKHIEVRYFVNIPGKKLFSFNVDVMEDNYSKEELLVIADEMEALKDYYIDLKKGDSYELTYIPGVGTQFEHNGNVKGLIKGERFAEILFSVWLGEKPFDKKIKAQILNLRDKPVEEGKIS